MSKMTISSHGDSEEFVTVETWDGDVHITTTETVYVDGESSQRAAQVSFTPETARAFASALVGYAEEAER